MRYQSLLIIESNLFLKKDYLDHKYKTFAHYCVSILFLLTMYVEDISTVDILYLLFNT